MAILSNIKSHPDANNYFKKLPFYNKPIERPIKCSKNIDPLVELPFDRFSKQTIIYRGENAADEFIKAILEEYKYCKK